ncbi:MAG: 6-carboxytetrahydropterin synthase [Bdellovibrionales bacterium]|nr:6-carboxytetrahydropterin synthase [Bdellovibrionales bacterium]
MTRLARRKAFQCLHKYDVKDWSTEKNASVFGACFTPHGHGHNYEMEVYLEGPVDPVTGMILNLIDVDAALDKVVAPLQGKHLNLEIAEFKDKVPTTELLAAYLFERVRAEVHAPVKLAKLRLYEYEDLWVDVWP